MQLMPEENIDALVFAHSQYHDHATNYDEVLHQVSKNIDSAGSIGKLDIGALAFWKRIRANSPWVRALMEWSDDDVRVTTKNAVEHARDLSKSTPCAAAEDRSALSPIPGFRNGDAMASALLLAAAPCRMAIYDRRAKAGLEQMGFSIKTGKGHYGRYIQLVEEICSVVNARRNKEWISRDVDIALFQMGK